MSNACIIAGTDTDVGKTVFASMLMLALNANYWKPIQCGVVDGVDTKTAQNYTGLPPERFFAEKYVLTEALSPHRAAEIDHVEIDLMTLIPPYSDAPLLIETAGGLMVPLNREVLQIDQYKRWNLPVILCARSGLGTINHTLLTLQAARARGLTVAGIILNQLEDEMDTAMITNKGVVEDLTGVPLLDHLIHGQDFIDAETYLRLVAKAGD